MTGTPGATEFRFGLSNFGADFARAVGGEADARRLRTALVMRPGLSDRTFGGRIRREVQEALEDGRVEQVRRLVGDVAARACPGATIRSVEVVRVERSGDGGPALAIGVVMGSSAGGQDITVALLARRAPTGGIVIEELAF